MFEADRLERAELGVDTLRVPRTDPAYNAHGYLTKVPVGAIVPFIDRFTERGELMLDPFAGSGMTGVAAYICGRRCILSDISELGRHVGTNFVNLVDPERFTRVATEVVARAAARVAKLYRTTCGSCGGPAAIAKVVWSFVYRCPSCAGEIVYYGLVAAEGAGGSTCPRCRNPFVRRTARRLEERPVAVFADCDHCGTNVERTADVSDRRAAAAAAQIDVAASWPDVPIPDDREMYRRSALGKSGLVSTGSFFSPRNLRALAVLRQEIDRVSDERLRSKLLFAFTAILPRASKRYQWGPKRPLNAQNQTYYVAPVFYEWNVLDLFQRKVGAAIRADEFIRSTAGGPLFADEGPRVEYRVGSAADLSWIEDSSVDYVFTDPPFGSNIFYSDMSLFQEAWLGRFTDPAAEAVIHTDSKRKATAARAYEDILTRALSECYRVLRPGRWATVVFSNSRGDVWAMLQRAVKRTGFDLAPAEVRILDKGQRSVKGLNSGREDVVTVDLILSLQKPPEPAVAKHGSRPTPPDPVETVQYVLASVAGQSPITPSHVYLAAIRHYLRTGFDLEQLHFADVLAALRSLGYQVDAEKGVLLPPSDPASPRLERKRAQAGKGIPSRTGGTT